MKKQTYLVTTVLLGTILLTAGCTTSKRHHRDVASLQAQIGSLQGEMARLDLSLQNTNAALQAVQQRGTPAAAPTGGSIFAAQGEGPVYRTPSGFELPARAIQQALRNAGYYNGEIDGKVGSGTKRAIREFQRAQGLTTDGVCGRQTWEQLKQFA